MKKNKKDASENLYRDAFGTDSDNYIRNDDANALVRELLDLLRLQTSYLSDIRKSVELPHACWKRSARLHA